MYYAYISKRESLRYDLNVNYTKKGKCQKSVDYLRPTYFNYLNNYFKKHPRVNNNININGTFRLSYSNGLGNTDSVIVLCVV